MKKCDYILIISYIIISIYISIVMISPIEESDETMIEVQYENKEILNIILNENKIIELEFGTNLAYLEIKDKKVRILEMPKSICPQQICSKFNWIYKKGDILVCLPNELTVEIKISSDISEIDAISF